MPEDKVVCFPNVSRTSSEKSNVAPAPLQPNLFDDGSMNRGRIVFLDITWLIEDTLLNIVAKNGVAALVDLRPRPVFERPRFRHRHVVHYLYERNINYLEYAMLARIDRGTGVRSPCWPEDVDLRFQEMLTLGLTVCIYDDGSRSAGWIEDFRHLVQTAPGYLAELHPRALVGTFDALGGR